MFTSLLSIGSQSQRVTEHQRIAITPVVLTATKPRALTVMLIAALPMQKINIVELYCGCGGLSFVDRKTEDVHIETKWAVDMEPSMCAAFKAKYPKAQVYSPPMIASHHWIPL